MNKYEPIVLPALMILITGIYFSKPDIEKLCQDNTISGMIYRIFVHESIGHLLVVFGSLIELFDLEEIIGPVKLFFLIIFLIGLSTFIQQISYRSVTAWQKLITKTPVIKTIQKEEKEVETKLDVPPDPSCSIGLSGLVLALIIILFYVVSKKGLSETWNKFQWNIFLLIPTILLAGVTIHGQISGLISGIITVLLLDFFRL